MASEDAIYYAHGMKLPLAQRITVYARKRMYEHFRNAMCPTPATNILDFGVSEHDAEEANVLERLYPHPSKITCAGIGSGAELKKAHPQVSYVSIRAHERLPFADRSFDIAYSNAVFEHLGSDAARKRIWDELNRVGCRVYVTVPNAWFPIEHHTGIPLLHYIPTLFRAVAARTALSFWADPTNLEFLTMARLRALTSERHANLAYCGLPLGPLSSNLALWTCG